jgi:hypothetical protein
MMYWTTIRFDVPAWSDALGKSLLAWHEHIKVAHPKVTEVRAFRFNGGTTIVWQEGFCDFRDYQELVDQEDDGVRGDHGGRVPPCRPWDPDHRDLGRRDMSGSGPASPAAAGPVRLPAWPGLEGAEDAVAEDRRVAPDEVMVYVRVLDRFETPAYERAWRFFRELAGACPDYESFRARCPLWSEPYAQFDRVLCTYETAAVLIRHGGLHEGLFFEQIPRVVDVWAAAAPWVQGLRQDCRAGLFRSVEWLAARMERWEREPGPRWCR